MKLYKLVLFFLLLSVYSQGQTLKKYAIGNSGCSFYGYCDAKINIEYSPDSSKVFKGECVVGDVSYGIICVKLLNPVIDLTAAEDLLIAYVDYIKTTVEIEKAAGYGRGHRLNNDENTRGILDYWEDAEKDKWKIKAWTDGSYIGFMFAYSSKDLPEPKVDAFLNGFVLPKK